MLGGWSLLLPSFPCPKQTLIFFQSLWICLFWTCLINGTIQNVAFYDWLPFHGLFKALLYVACISVLYPLFKKLGLFFTCPQQSSLVLFIYIYFHVLYFKGSFRCKRKYVVLLISFNMVISISSSFLQVIRLYCSYWWNNMPWCIHGTFSLTIRLLLSN